jgi:hypothetical protein
MDCRKTASDATACPAGDGWTIGARVTPALTVEREYDIDAKTVSATISVAAQNVKRRWPCLL